MSQSQARKPAHSPNSTGGQWDGANAAMSDDLEPCAQAYHTKDRVDALARMGRLREAADLARRAGAFVPAMGDRLPYGHGAIAIFDGRSLESADVDGARITMHDGFHPETITHR